jgi:hypothetical protein
MGTDGMFLEQVRELLAEVDEFSVCSGVYLKRRRHEHRGRRVILNEFCSVWWWEMMDAINKI